MQRFIVSDAPHRTVRSRDNTRSFFVQSCGLVGRDGLAQRFDLWVNESESLYKPGQYVLDPELSIYVDRKGNLAIRPVLIPAPATADTKPKAA